MSEIHLRTMYREDWNEVARLVHESTNAWYTSHGRPAIFQGPKDSTLLFPQVYEQLDPGCCVVAVDTATGRLAGSCFYHPRPTHVSLGIMNVHPDYFGRSIAGRLLRYVTDLADESGKAVRLVSSAMNLDSYSLYSRAGFVPRMIFQDMILRVPDEGLSVAPPRIRGVVRAAREDDAVEMAKLEMELAHMNRESDFRHFIENADRWWHVSVLENLSGELDGFLVSIQHAGSQMLGPGIARTPRGAAALIHSELNHRAGHTMVWLVPAQCPELVATMYSWGARNCEIHFGQVRGEWPPCSGIMMPTFMPETG